MTAPTALWTETQQVALSDGFYSLELGTVTSLPVTALMGTERWIELTVAGTALSPRQRLSSVPYAMVARDVAGGGTVQANSVILSGGGVTVNGVQVIDPTGNLNPDAGGNFARSAHLHDAADVATGTLALARVPQGWTAASTQTWWTATTRGTTPGNWR